jgi:hypothetical protein
MQDKHKVTLYLPPALHRQLKVKAAVDFEPMSTIAERAIVFYLTHSDVVDEVEMSHGQANKIYDCPQCSSSLVVRDGEMAVVGNTCGNGEADRYSILLEDSAATLPEVQVSSDQKDEGELVVSMAG